MREGILARHRVLVVEDNPILGSALQRILADAGAEVIGPTQVLVFEAKAMAAEPLSAAVVDTGMANELAQSLVEAIKCSGVPVLIYSSHDQASPGFIEHLEIGMEAAPEDLVEAVRRVVSARTIAPAAATDLSCEFDRALAMVRRVMGQG